MLKIGARYKRWRQVGAHRAYQMCHVLEKTEISEKEAAELEEVKG